MFGLILILLALIFFALATLGVPSHPRFTFGWAGLFCVTLWLFLGSHPHISG